MQKMKSMNINLTILVTFIIGFPNLYSQNMQLNNPSEANNFNDAEQYLLKAHKISYNDNSIPAFIYAEVTQNLLRIGNTSKKGIYPSSYDENQIRTFERIEFQGYVSTLTSSELKKIFKELNEPLKWIAIKQLVQKGDIENAESLVEQNELNPTQFATALIDNDLDIWLVDKYYFKQLNKTKSIRGSRFDHYVGQNLRNGNITLKECLDLLNKSGASDNVKTKIIARNIPFSSHYQKFPDYLRSVSGRDEIRIIENLADNIEEINKKEQLNFLKDILIDYNYNRKVFVMLERKNTSKRADKEISERLFNKLTETNQLELSQATIELIKTNKELLSQEHLSKLLSTRDETNVLLRLSTTLIELEEYSKAEECADQKESGYHYKMIELLAKKDELKIARKWIHKYSTTEEDIFSTTKHIVLSLYRQNKKEEIESIIADVNNYWKVRYYIELAKQCIETSITKE